MAVTRRALLASFGVGGLAAAAGADTPSAARTSPTPAVPTRASDRRLPRSPPGGHRHARPGSPALRGPRRGGRRARERPARAAAYVVGRGGADDGRTAGRRCQRRGAGAAGGHRRGARPDAGASHRHLRPRPLAVRRSLRPERSAAGAVADAAGAARRRARPGAQQRRPVRPGVRRRPAGRLPRRAQPGAHRARRGDGALVAAGLRAHRVDEPAQATPRNLLGFKDGTANLKAEDPDALARHVWVPATAERAGVAARRHLPRRPAHPHAHRGLGPHVARRPGADDRPPQGHGRPAGRARRVRDAEGRIACPPTATCASPRPR